MFDGGADSKNVVGCVVKRFDNSLFGIIVPYPLGGEWYCTKAFHRPADDEFPVRVNLIVATEFYSLVYYRKICNKEAYGWTSLHYFYAGRFHILDSEPKCIQVDFEHMIDRVRWVVMRCCVCCHNG